MGYTSIRGWSKQQVIEDLTKTHNREGGAYFKTLAHTCRGNVLWTVHEQFQGGKTVRFIGCYLLSYDRHNDGYGYKDMDETMGPCYYTCPVKYFELAGEPISEGAKTWREKVVARQAVEKNKRSKLKALVVGAKVVLADGCSIRGQAIKEGTVMSVKPLVVSFEGVGSAKVKKTLIVEVRS